MSATARFVDVDGIRLHLLEAGQGRPLVLLHGNGAIAADFEISGLLGLAAERGWRAIAFDRPGSGFSERPRGRLWTPRAQAALFARAISVLGLERPCVLGHSWGALPAAALALDHPEIVSGLALLSGYYFPRLMKEIALISPIGLPLVGDLFRFTIGPATARALAPHAIRRIFAPSEPPERFVRNFWLDLAARPSQLRAVGEDTAFQIPAAAALRKRYAELSLPTVILAGDSDRIVSHDRHSVPLHEMITGSRLRIFPDQGHMPHYFVGEAIMEALEALAAPE